MSLLRKRRIVRKQRRRNKNKKIYTVVMACYRMQKTTIQIGLNTLGRLKMFKKHERESYDFVLNNILDEAEDDEITSEEIEDIKKALEEVKRGRVYSIEDVARDMGIVLR